MEQKTVFISYRRNPAGKHLSRLIYQFLTHNGYDVFLDVVTMDNGDFDRIILNQIAARAHFILVLSDGALARCVNPGDWVLREIEEALRLERNIIPVIDEGVKIEDEMAFLPAEVRARVQTKNAVKLSHDYFDAFAERVRSFLKQPVTSVVVPTPTFERVEVSRRIAAADAEVKAESRYTAELVVDVRGTGQYTRITDALTAAPAGARITVKPGTYTESLKLTKPVTIEGQGDRSRIIVQSDAGDCIFMDTDEATVSGLSLRCVAGSRGVKCYGVNIPKGRLLLRDCDITSDSLACVAIHNPAARPYLVDCVIHDGKTMGLQIYENGGGVIEDCVVYGNTLAGLEIITGGNPTVRRCIFRDGKGSGMFVYKNGDGVIEDCEVYGNTFAGLAIQTGGNPTVRRCTFRDGKAGGVYVYENGGGVIEDCEVYGNAFAGLEIKTGGNPTVRRCTFRDGKTGGVFVNDNGGGVIEDCKVYGNTNAGLAIKTGGNPIIRRCTISKNGYEAIWVYVNGKATVEDCDLRGNKRGAWDIDSSSSVTRRNNLE
ncbi:MAG: right-handed parallel beta-helix repeat-containing protein [Anaerolineae bacterium]|jgi:parallel beta-helix repeat protein|nr:right-handed parallel beta-helix repeat-containing protein [Anaerolineae bacterium]